MTSSSLRCIGFTSAALFSAWACKPDLDALSAAYAGGTGGTGASAGFTSGGSGDSTGSGGTNGVDPGGEGGMPASGGVAGSATAGAGDSGGDSGAPPEPPESCENDERDSDESDVDCGGSSDCERCDDESRCTDDDDCASNFCKDSRCAEPTCADGYENQDETATDCGGSCAPESTCDLGDACRADKDCTSAYCKNQVCTDHCTSDRKDADETDEDCGGSDCDACDDLLSCERNEDCVSQHCADDVCQVATCGDGIQNQDESDEDCGGVCALEAPCELDELCNGGADCATYVCTSGHCAPDIVIVADDVIDDFEDQNIVIGSAGARIGNWYPYGDGTGAVNMAITTLPGTRGPASAFGLHTDGSGFTSWGSGVGADLKNSGGAQATKEPYDASAYAGVTFWARAETAAAVTLVLPNKDTDAAGDTCVVCDHHYLRALTLTTTWQRYTVLFSELSLEPGGDPVPTAFAADGVVSVQFRFNPGSVYDVWIDDVAFVR